MSTKKTPRVNAKKIALECRIAYVRELPDSNPSLLFRNVARAVARAAELRAQLEAAEAAVVAEADRLDARCLELWSAEDVKAAKHAANEYGDVAEIRRLMGFAVTE
jgi:hypothetical protein